MTVDVPLLFAIAGVALITGLSKGGLGGALGGLITPVLSIFMPVQDAIAIGLPLFIAGDWVSVRTYWRQWDNRIIRETLPVAIIGVVVGTSLLANLPNATLRIILGVLTLMVGVYKLLEPRIRTLRYSPRPWHGLLAGILSGTGSALASAGGPVYTAYLLLQKLHPLPFIATTALFFALVNLMRLPGFIIAGLFDWELFEVLVWFMPLVWLGVWLGRQIVDHINPYIFEQLMIAFMIVAGAILLV
jgi:uncharacterized membrane protein YfcA